MLFLISRSQQILRAATGGPMENHLDKSLMAAPADHQKHAVWAPIPIYNSDKVKRVQRRAARFVKSRYIRYSSFSYMLDDWGGRLFLKGDRMLD